MTSGTKGLRILRQAAPARPVNPDVFPAAQPGRRPESPDTNAQLRLYLRHFIFPNRGSHGSAAERHSKVMLWATGFICLAIGAAAGYFLAGRLNASPTKISQLEQQLQDLQRSHARYKEEVSEHFSTTAGLVQQMTDSYRDVYQHLAIGAQELCSGDVASQLLPAASDGMFNRALTVDEAHVQAPRDYAPKQTPGQSGALSEGFGLEKIRASDRDYL